MTDQTREQFEAWYYEQENFSLRAERMAMSYAEAQAAFEAGWQAAHASLDLAARDKLVASLAADAQQWREREERKAKILAAGMLRRPLRAPKIGEDE